MALSKKKIIGIMGPGRGATPTDLETAFEVGKKLAEQGFSVLTGGRATGVMEAAMKGAKAAGGTTIGILPSVEGAGRSEFADFAINTGLGNARNNINVLTSDVVVAIGTGVGTTSEIALAIKNGKPVILMNQTKEALHFFRSFNYPHLYEAGKEEKALEFIHQVLDGG